MEVDIALTGCKGCGEEISKNAKACPHCGEPAKAKTSGCTWIVAVLFLLPLFIVMMMAIFKGDSSTSAVIPEKSNAECLASVDCIFDRYQITAEVECPVLIQKYAKHDYRWSDGVLGHKFTKVVRVDDGTVVRFIGDSLQFQNGFSAWTNVVYSCDIDTASDVVLQVSAEEGRL